MTDKQMAAIKSLCERFGTDTQYTDIVECPFDLPPDWVSVVVYEKGSFHRVKIVAGVSPEGNIHS